MKKEYYSYGLCLNKEQFNDFIKLFKEEMNK